jgi:HK97 family phage major capsid protein
MTNTLPATVTGDFNVGFLQPALVGPIFERAAQLSVVQRLARKVDLAPNSTNITVVSQRPVATWVAQAAQKQTTSGGISLVNMAPHKMAAILVVSQEVVRANPANYLSTMQEELATAFAIAFDAAALHGTNSPFASNLDATTKAVELGSTAHVDGGVYKDLAVTTLGLLVNDNSAPLNRRRRLTGFAFDLVAEPTLNGSLDAQGRPLFVPGAAIQGDNIVVNPGTVIGRPAVMTEGVATADGTSVIGYAGDWTQAVWGQIGGINYAVSDQTAVTINGALVSLWENNLVAVRAETEYGFLVNDAKSFVKLTNVVANS